MNRAFYRTILDAIDTTGLAIVPSMSRESGFNVMGRSVLVGYLDFRPTLVRYTWYPFTDAPVIIEFGDPQFVPKLQAIVDGIVGDGPYD